MTGSARIRLHLANSIGGEDLRHAASRWPWRDPKAVIPRLDRPVHPPAPRRW